MIFVDTSAWCADFVADDENHEKARAFGAARREEALVTADKGWSFTDCVSYAVIERLRIKKAFAFDRHFRQLARQVLNGCRSHRRRGPCALRASA